MNVTIDPEVLHDSGAFEYLDQLRELFSKGRHRWIDADPTQTMDSGWAKSLGDRHQKSLRALLRSAQSAPPFRQRARLRISLHPRGPACASPAAACATLREPLKIIVEDPEGHGALLDRLFLDLDPVALEQAIGPAEASAIRHNWRPRQGDGQFFSILPGGGRDIGNELRRKASPLPGRLPDSIFVIVDSDRRAPTEGTRPGSTAEGAKKAAEALVTPAMGKPWVNRVYVLAKREVENYIPSTVLKKLMRSPSVWTAWSRLRHDQQDHISLKSGLRKDLAERDDASHWAGVPVSDWCWRAEPCRDLWSGLSQEFAESLRDAPGVSASQAFDANLWAGPDRDDHIQGLRIRDGVAELPALLQTLIDLL